MKRSTKNAEAAAPVPSLLTSRQAAKMLAVSERTLWSLSASREIPRVRVGRSVRYDVEDLRRFIAERKEGEL